MAHDFKRSDRVAQLLQRKLALLIQQEVKDPRLPGFITVSAAEVSKDLAHAKIYFTVFNGDPKIAEQILNSAASYLRSVIAKSLTLRIAPQLHFIYDKSIEYGSRLSRLIDQVNQSSEDSKDEESD
jgi:ribosome-binding factor A